MMEKKNIGNLNWEMVAKYLNKESSTRENVEMENWINHSEENRKEFEHIQKMLENVDHFYTTKKFDASNAWKEVHTQINPKKVVSLQQKANRKEVIARFYKYAAVAVVAILLGSVGYYIGFKNQEPAFYNEIISAENQVLKEYVLPDGSLVALNSDSRLEFPRKFKGDVREVTIIGEAFFDVKPNPDKPFVINAGDAQVKVLGTSFNVSAYPGAETVEVIVKTGKVQVVSKANEETTITDEVFLTPGEKGTLFTENLELEKTVNTNPNFIAWKTHNLVFNKVPLTDVIQCLEKAYHVDIDFTDPEMNYRVYNGEFSDEPIETILNVIRLTFNLELSVEVKNEHYTLTSRTNKQ